MLRNEYAPSDFLPRDTDPSVSSADKLKAIAKAPVQATVLNPETIMFSLPYGPYAWSRLPRADQKTLRLDEVSVTDEALCGHGIGSRLVMGAARFALEHALVDQPITALSTDRVRLGLVNTFVRVFGEENVTVSDEIDYGRGTNQPLEKLLDIPPDDNGHRIFESSFVHLDLLAARDWESPVVVPASAE